MRPILVSGGFLEGSWWVSGRFLVGFWRVSGRFLVGFCKVSGGFLENRPHNASSVSYVSYIDLAKLAI